MRYTPETGRITSGCQLRVLTFCAIHRRLVTKPRGKTSRIQLPHILTSDTLRKCKPFIILTKSNVKHYPTAAVWSEEWQNKFKHLDFYWDCALPTNGPSSSAALNHLNTWLEWEENEWFANSLVQEVSLRSWSWARSQSPSGNSRISI